jgi:hypothetical protein
MSISSYIFDWGKINVPVVEQVVGFMVRQIQSGSGSGSQRHRPRVQPIREVLLLTSTDLVILLMCRTSLLTIILVRGVPRADLAFFGLEE